MSEEIDFEADAGALAPSQDVLLTISQLIEKQLIAETVVHEAEKLLKDAKEKLRIVQERELPDALAAAGVGEFKTTDGVIVGIEGDLTMSVPKHNLTVRNDWLKANKLGALVKPTVTVTLQKGQDNERAMIEEWLTKNGFSFETGEQAHTASVKAAFKKLIEAGTELPLEMFGGYQYRKAIIKLPT